MSALRVLVFAAHYPVASGRYMRDAFGRIGCDVRTIGLHVMLNFNAAAENYGRHALGFPLNPRDPFF